MKRFLLISVVFTFFVFGMSAQKVGLKTNGAHWAMAATPNLGVEIALGKKYTLEIGAGYNPFTFNDNKKFKHLIVQPEIRYWLCESFNGHFFGLHALAAQYNVGGIDIPLGRLKTIKDNRYEGYLYGAGISYGYQWVLSPRWNFEASIGAGYARIHYSKFPCNTCGTKLDEGNYDYLGVTKAALSLIYLLK